MQGVMGHKKSSKRWLDEHFSDPFVKKAQTEGYRSRAVYKLEELCQKDNLLREGLKIVDLGAAPGGWSQYLAKRLKNSQIIAMDILPMEPLPEVEFIQGDFQEEAVLEQLLQSVNNRGIDLVISDMAPNISGHEAVDQAKSMYLCELALDFARQVSAEQGNFVCKVFQGKGFDDLVSETRALYKTVKIRKPKASRDRSREVYVVGLGFKK